VVCVCVKVVVCVQYSVLVDHAGIDFNQNHQALQGQLLKFYCELKQVLSILHFLKSISYRYSNRAVTLIQQPQNTALKHI